MCSCCEGDPPGLAMHEEILKALAAGLNCADVLPKKSPFSRAPFGHADKAKGIADG